MNSDIIMTVKASRILSNSWKSELIITSAGVEGEMLVVGKRTRGFIPYHKIAAVTIQNKIFSSTLSILNTGGVGNITINGLNKKKARQVSTFLNEKIAMIPRTL
jgi:hypothetical protein